MYTGELMKSCWHSSSRLTYVETNRIIYESDLPKWKRWAKESSFSFDIYTHYAHILRDDDLLDEYDDDSIMASLIDPFIHK